jgi:hypothetical protein
MAEPGRATSTESCVSGLFEVYLEEWSYSLEKIQATGPGERPGTVSGA